MTWVEERPPDLSGGQLELHRGGRWSAPAQAPSPTLPKLALRSAALVLGVLTLAGVGAAASWTQLPSAGALLGSGLAFNASAGTAWLAPLSSGSVAPEARAQTPRARQASAPPPEDARRDAGPVRPTHDEAAPPGLTPEGKVILNQAGAADLQRLPGIGKKRAASILRLRERLGRFRRMHDLLRVRGIGRRALRKIRDHAVLDPPKQDAGS